MFTSETLRFSRRVFASGVLLGFSVLAMPAGAQTTQRSITEFVEAQGNFCFPDGSGGCLQFVPPVENFIGWTDTKNFLGVSVDYAGLADDALGGALGTTFAGGVTERRLSDGRALIKVDLHTSNANVWVIPFDPTSPENQFGENDLLFGARVTDIIEGATPALGSSHFGVEFTMPATGLPLPDLEQIIFAPELGQELLSVHFTASANGTFADGSSGKVQVSERGIFDNGFHGAVGDGFPAEKINLLHD